MSTEEAKRAGKAAVMFGGGRRRCWIGLLLASMAIAWLLDHGLSSSRAGVVAIRAATGTGRGSPGGSTDIETFVGCRVVPA